MRKRYFYICESSCRHFNIGLPFMIPRRSSTHSHPYMSLVKNLYAKMCFESFFYTVTLHHRLPLSILFVGDDIITTAVIHKFTTESLSSHWLHGCRSYKRRQAMPVYNKYIVKHYPAKLIYLNFQSQVLSR